MTDYDAAVRALDVRTRGRESNSWWGRHQVATTPCLNKKRAAFIFWI